MLHINKLAVKLNCNLFLFAAYYVIEMEVLEWQNFSKVLMKITN
jgi:hypothetical protein